MKVIYNGISIPNQRKQLSRNTQTTKNSFLDWYFFNEKYTAFAAPNEVF